jgi:F420H(2)-dependent quinone reductase
MEPPKPKSYHDMKPLERAFAKTVIKHSSAAQVAIYKATSGRLGKTFFGRKVCLLTTVGRKTGEKRVAPLLYLEDGKNVVVVASKGGWVSDPLWYKNLVAAPRVRVQIGALDREFMARTASDAERDALWPRLCAMYPSYQDYQNVTDRKIPVVICEPA